MILSNGKDFSLDFFPRGEHNFEMTFPSLETGQLQPGMGFQEERNCLLKSAVQLKAWSCWPVVS